MILHQASHSFTLYIIQNESHLICYPFINLKSFNLTFKVISYVLQRSLHVICLYKSSVDGGAR